MSERKQNYQAQMEAYIAAHPEKEMLALHSCCGPCSSYVLECLTHHFDVTLYYYNPNIHPKEEYEHRLSEQKRLCAALGVAFVECPYDPETYFDAVRGLEQEKEGGKRCSACFDLRLRYTAQKAKEAGIVLFTTTLTVSPHKNAEEINRIGNGIAEEYGIRWLPCDFKKKEGYKRSIELSREYGLYRQDYCGCVFSDWHETAASE